MKKLTGLRRRLTYANVIATLALFFALTGGAMAGVKYLVAADTIPATSDLAGSTYGNPQIAAGKVTSDKIANGAITSSKFDSSALAPNADKLDGLDSSAFALAGSSYTKGESDARYLGINAKAADSALLDGKTLSEVRSGIDAATLDGKNASAFGAPTTAFPAAGGTHVGTGYTTVASRTLPAGTYVVLALAEGSSPSTSSSACNLEGSAAAFLDGAVTETFGHFNLPLMAVVTYAAPGPISVSCTILGAGGGGASASIVAVRVDSVG
jgi:hypothetical protein